jgi:uncharacterized protein YjiS (DUF1127 family)
MEIRSFTMISVAREPTAVTPRRDHRQRTTSLIARVARALAVWRRRARSRGELARLGERDLRDIGLTPAEAARECAKPFWRG